MGAVTNNWASSPTAYPFFIVKVRLERTRLRGCSTSVSSPLVSVVSGTRCCWCDTDGPWLSLPNTSSSSDNKITHGETKELRNHTDQFRSTNCSLMDSGADYSPPLPQSDKETVADVLLPEWGKTKDRRITDLMQEKIRHKHGATRSNNRIILIWNKVCPHRTPCPTAVDSYFGSGWPQQDNAGPPASGTSLLVTTSRLLRTTLLLSKPVDTSPAPSPPVSCSVPTTQTQLCMNVGNTTRKIRRDQY